MFVFIYVYDIFVQLLFNAWLKAQDILALSLCHLHSTSLFDLFSNSFDLYSIQFLIQVKHFLSLIYF